MELELPAMTPSRRLRSAAPATCEVWFSRPRDAGLEVERPVADVQAIAPDDRRFVVARPVEQARVVGEVAHHRDLVHAAEPAQQDRGRRERADASTECLPSTLLSSGSSPRSMSSALTLSSMSYSRAHAASWRSF